MSSRSFTDEFHRSNNQLEKARWQTGGVGIIPADISGRREEKSRDLGQEAKQLMALADSFLPYTK